MGKWRNCLQNLNIGMCVGQARACPQCWVRKKSTATRHQIYENQNLGDFATITFLTLAYIMGEKEEEKEEKALIEQMTKEEIEELTDSKISKVEVELKKQILVLREEIVGLKSKIADLEVSIIKGQTKWGLTTIFLLSAMMGIFEFMT